MSYSFVAKAKTKDEVMVAVKAEFDKVLEAQPTHFIDREAAENAVKAFISIIKDPDENEVVAVSVSGSVQWREMNPTEAKDFIGAGVSINTYVGVNA